MLHTANTLTCFECCFEYFFYTKKNIESFENVFSHGFLKHKKTISFLAFLDFYNMFIKPQRVLANIPKNIKNLILGGIDLLFTANIWIKKSLKDEYPKYYWE